MTPTGRRFVAGVLALCATLACAKKWPPAKPRAKPPKLEIYAFGDANSNGGHALQVVIRAVEEKEFIEDSYSDIAGLVSDPDKSVLDVVTVFPGEPTFHSTTLELEEVPASVGVYGLFRDTKDSEWKILIETRGEVNFGTIAAREAGLGGEVRVIEFAADYGSLRDLNDPEQGLNGEP